MTHLTGSHDTLGGDLTPRHRASFLRVVRDQRKAVIVAMVLMMASFWVIVPLGRLTLAGCVAGGVLLGLLNHLATELWLLKLITSGEERTRNKMVAETIVRQLVLTVVAVGIAVMFWPEGIGLLLGLAIFRLIALVMTGIPLLKELNKP